MFGLKKRIRGASLTGYALTVGLISVFALAAVSQLGGSVSSLFGNVCDAMDAAGVCLNQAGNGNGEGDGNGEGEGSEGDLPGPPALLSFARHSPADATTSDDVLVFRASFSEPVTHVDAADFAANGTSAGVSSVASAPGGAAWDVTVSGGDLAALTGTVGLDLAGAQNITDLAGNALPAGEPATDETYTLDQTVCPSDPSDPGDIGCFAGDGSIFAGSVGGRDVYAAAGDEGSQYQWDGGQFTVTYAESVTDGLVNTLLLMGPDQAEHQRFRRSRRAPRRRRLHGQDHRRPDRLVPARAGRAGAGL
jgi:Flp pilus assembly pilin Flp